MNLRKKRRVTQRFGFTLMEMMAVVAIIVMLAGAATWGFMRYQESSRIGKAKMDLSKINLAVETYYTDHNNNYPDNLQVLTVPEGNAPAYLDEKLLIDPWGRPYRHDFQQRDKTGRVLIWSEGSGKDIRNWDL